MITKLLTWLKVNLASVLATVQTALKAVKEVLTAIVNVISIIMPATAAQKLVLTIRDAVNMVDDWIEKMKVVLLPKV